MPKVLISDKLSAESVKVFEKYGIDVEINTNLSEKNLNNKIRSFDGNDDFKAMEEVIARRYGRLLREKSKFPDLVVVDGGVGQVSSAMNAFESLGCTTFP